MGIHILPPVHTALGVETSRSIWGRSKAVLAGASKKDKYAIAATHEATYASVVKQQASQEVVKKKPATPPAKLVKPPAKAATLAKDSPGSAQSKATPAPVVQQPTQAEMQAEVDACDAKKVEAQARLDAAKAAAALELEAKAAGEEEAAKFLEMAAEYAHLAAEQGYLASLAGQTKQVHLSRTGERFTRTRFAGINTESRTSKHRQQKSRLSLREQRPPRRRSWLPQRCMQQLKRLLQQLRK